MENYIYRDTLETIKQMYPNKLTFKIEEVADILSVDKRTVYQFLKREKNPLRKMSTGKRVIRISLSSLAHFMAER